RFEREQNRMQNMWMARKAELQELVGKDELTQLQNRRFFYEQLQQELDLAIRYRREVSILMIDVDDLKLINDEFGHQVGDVVLRALGRVLNQQAGDRNITARVGGDEFAIILPGGSSKDAEKLSWAIWEALSKEPICETETASIFLGISIGAGGHPWGGLTLDEIIHWADTKLYANKLERKGLKHTHDAASDQRLVGAVVDVLSSALDVRDRMTHRHARRVAHMSAFVAREMKLSGDQVVQIEYAAALHDIGKIGVADSILHKDASLDNEEWKQMKLHSNLGYQILNGIDFLQDAAEIVYSHHERFDGNGYPRGLTGEETPLGARVFAVVDAYDAMTSRRPYREPMSQQDAIEEIGRHAGTQFDPTVVAAFLSMMKRGLDRFQEPQDEFGTTFVDGGGHKNGHRNGHKNGHKSLDEALELLPID
ncbi:MAG: HD domain-containing phosphohydrolase, partial [Dehalococcoidia bacterium]